MEAYYASFAGGEVSPEIAARADLAKYSVYCKECLNMIIQPQGGVRRRPGTVFIGECGTSGTDNADKRLVPFIIGVDECYVLEFGTGYMRAYTQAGPVLKADSSIFELETPFSGDNIRHLSFAQAKDTLIVVDGEHIKELTRSVSSGGIVSFSIADYLPKYGPFMNESQADAPQGYITKESNLVYLNTGINTFTDSDVDRQYRLKVYIDAAKITYSGSDMNALKSQQVVCYSSWALRVKTGWTGTIKLEYSEDGTNWNTFRTLATSNDNTEWAITGSFATEEQPVFVRFNGVGGGVSGTVNLAFETTGFWYYLIMEVQQRISERKAKIKFVDVPDLIFDFLPALGYSKQWSFPKITGYTSTSAPISEIVQDGNKINAVVGGNALALKLWQLRDGDSSTSCEITSVFTDTDTTITLTPNDLISGGTVNIKVGGSFKFSTSDDDFDGSPFTIDVKCVKEDDSNAFLGDITIRSSNYEKIAGTNEYSIAELTGTFTLPAGTVLKKVYIDIFSNDGDCFDFSVNITDFAIDSYKRKSFAVGRPAWTTERGMPRAVAQFQQRLVFGGTKTEPDVIWATETGEKYSFFKNVNIQSADSITTSIEDNKSSKIMALSSLRSLIVFCMGAEFCLGSDIFAPATSGFTKQSEYGYLDGCGFEVVENKIIFPQNMGTALREFSYDYANDIYAGRDISLYAKHLFRGRKIKELAYQQEPDSVLWAVLDSGEVLSCTYLPEQEVLAWAKHDLGGEAVSICSIYGNRQNDIFFIVKRKIGNAYKYYVEALSHESSDIKNACYLDCAYRRNESTAAASFTAEHLAGAGIIDVMADGKYLPGVDISAQGEADISGAVPDGAKDIVAGFRYESILKTLPINTDGQNVLINKKIRFPYLDVYLHESVSCKVGFMGREKEKILSVYKNYNACPELREGWHRVQLNSSHEMGAYAEVSTDEPYPLNVLGLIVNAVI